MHRLLLHRLAMAALPACVLASSVATPASAEIRIGVIAPMTGPFQALGQQIRIGVEAAVADLNAKGGIDGEPVSVDIGDDACKADDAAAAANHASGRGDSLIVGPVCAAAGRAAGAVFASKGIVAITPAITANSFTDTPIGPGIFRLAARDDAQGAAAGAYLASHFDKSRIAILNDGSPYGKALADTTKLGLNAAGMQEARSEAFNSGEKEYLKLADRLIADEIDVVFIGGYQGDIALILKALRDKGSQAIVMGGDALATSEFAGSAGGLADGTLLTFFTDWRTAPSASAVAAEMRAAGNEPVGFALPAYAAVQVWAAARAAAGDDPAAIAARIGSQPTTTVLGETAFDAKGDVKLPGYAVYRWSNGTFSPVETP